MVSPRMFPALLTALVALPLAAQEGPKALSLQEAITTSLKNNLQVKIAQTAQEQGAYGIKAAQGAFDWNLSSAFAYKRNLTDTSTSRVTDFTMPNGSTLNSGLLTNDAAVNTRSLTVGIDRALEWGGDVNASYTPVYKSTLSHNYLNPIDPAGSALAWNSKTGAPWSGGLNLAYTQPLLRNFGREVASSTLLIARKNAENVDLTYEARIIQLVSDTENLYWNVVYAERNLANKKRALELAQKQLRENRIRVEVGTMAPIEVTSAEAAEAIQLQAIIQAEADIANAKDALMRALYPDQNRPADFQLTDAPTIQRLQLTEEAAQKLALQRRVELKAARLGVDIARISQKVAERNRLPQLDLNLGMSALSNPSANYSGINTDLTKRSNPGYSVGVTFSMPIQNRAAEANLSSKRAQTRSNELTLRDLELSTMLEVRTALRSVEAAEKGVKAAELSRVFSEKDLDAEQKKFDNGMSTNFVVLQKQSALDATRSSELSAQITYAKSVTAFEKAVGNLLEARKLSLK